MSRRRTLSFEDFLLLLANHQHEERDDYDELHLAFQLFDLGTEPWTRESYWQMFSEVFCF